MTDVRQDIEAEASRVETRLVAHWGQRPFAADRLDEASRYSLLAGGKRLRPVLCLWTHDALRDSRDDAVWSAAMALEMVHTYSLVHDDLPSMDDDDLRRGKPTCHVAFDEATAVLAGDALLTEAFAVLAESGGGLAGRLAARLADAAGGRGMVAGQQRDLDADDTQDDWEPLEAIHRLKTGRLFGAALAMGAICGGLSEPSVDRVDQAGQSLGIAFQIVDDLLDERGTAEELGKTAGKDRAQRKLTAVTSLGFETAEREAQRRLTEALAGLEAAGVQSPKLTGLAQALVQRRR